MSIPGGSPLSPTAAPGTSESPPGAPLRLVLVRHAESTWNSERRIQGQLDPPLSDHGVLQAQALAERLAESEPAAIYSSDLSRAWQTCEPLADRLGLEPVREQGLREVALGLWEGKRREELEAEFPREWASWVRRPSWDLAPGGEGSRAFRERVRGALASIFERHPEGDVVVVTHGGVIQVLLATALGQSPSGLFPFLIENCSLSTLQRSGERTVITGVNDTCHLA